MVKRRKVEVDNAIKNGNIGINGSDGNKGVVDLTNGDQVINGNQDGNNGAGNGNNSGLVDGSGIKSGTTGVNDGNSNGNGIGNGTKKVSFGNNMKGNNDGAVNQGVADNKGVLDGGVINQQTFADIMQKTLATVTEGMVQAVSKTVKK